MCFSFPGIFVGYYLGYKGERRLNEYIEAQNAAKEKAENSEAYLEHVGKKQNNNDQNNKQNPT